MEGGVEDDGSYGAIKTPKRKKSSSLSLVSMSPKTPPPPSPLLLHSPAKEKMTLTTCRSPSTGLLCLQASPTSASLSLAIRQSLARTLGPALVIMNTAGRGDVLELGLQLEEEQKLEQVLEKAAWELPDITICSLLTSAKDPFAWVSRLPQIPRVGGSGLYQIAVSRIQDEDDCSRRKPAKSRSTLEDLTSGLDCIAKLVHGEGESLVQVGHMLQALVYTAHLGQVFPTKLQHVWQSGSLVGTEQDWIRDSQRHYLVTLGEDKLRDSSVPQRQLFVHHQLNSLGRVLHLEQVIFGVPGLFLAVVEQPVDSCPPSLKPALELLEVGAGSLPDQYRPSYMVDSLGFYVVSGKFPEEITAPEKDKFAKEMVELGAVGFRKGEEEHGFCLHFVKSGNLHLVGISPHYGKFCLVIQSGLVEKKEVMRTVKKLHQESKVMGVETRPEEDERLPTIRSETTNTTLTTVKEGGKSYDTKEINVVDEKQIVSLNESTIVSRKVENGKAAEVMVHKEGCILGELEQNVSNQLTNQNYENFKNEKLAPAQVSKNKIDVAKQVGKRLKMDRKEIIRELPSVVPFKNPEELITSIKKITQQSKTVRTSDSRNNSVFAKALACRVFLTEEQVFSLQWRDESLFRDNTRGKVLSRHLTAFLKTVRLALFSSRLGLPFLLSGVLR